MVHKSAKVNWRNIKDDKFELSISSSETVDSLMKKIEAVNGVALAPESILVDGEPLASGQPLAAYGINKGSRLELVPLEPDAYEDLPDGSPSLTSPNHLLHRHWQAAREGLAAGSAPKLVAAGTGGSYFLQDVQGQPVAVFKPEDEEPLAVNNPKGRTPGSSVDGGSSSGNSEGLRRGTKPGEGAYREVAAYVLDHNHFSGVPPTALVSAYVDSVEGGAVKIGSLQQFVQSDGDCEVREQGHTWCGHSQLTTMVGAPAPGAALRSNAVLQVLQAYVGRTALFSILSIRLWLYHLAGAWLQSVSFA